MTRDEFESRYRLLQEVTRAGGATTHNAIGPAGAVVMVHVLDDEVEEWVRSLVDLPVGDRPDRILTLLDVDGSAVLVTRFIMDFPDLETWLGSLTPTAPPEPPPTPGDAPGAFTTMFEATRAPDPGETPDPEPTAGEFTALFRSPATPEEAESAPSVQTPDEGTTPQDVRGTREPDGSPVGSDRPTPAAPLEGPGGTPPGEFTRMFGAMDAPDPPREESGTEVEAEPTAAPAPKSKAPRPPLPTQPPFRPPTPDPDPPPPTVARPAERPLPPLPSPPPVRPPPSDPPTIPGGIPEPRYGVPSEPDSREEATPPDPAGFTARFARPSPEWPAPEPARGPDSWPSPEKDEQGLVGGGDDYLDRLYSDRPKPGARPSGPPPLAQTPPPGAGPPTPGGSAGPGAYTRVIAGVKAPMSGASPPPPMSSTSDRGKPDGEERASMIPFLIIIGLIVILAVALVVGYVLLSNR